MKSRDLAVLLRASKDDAFKVASQIFNQDKLDEDDHEFLHEHLHELPLRLLTHWLTRTPPRPGPILAALFAAVPDESSLEGWIVETTIINWPARLEQGVLDDVVDRLLPRLTPWQWWNYAKYLKGMSPFFHVALDRQEDCELAVLLFPHRRHDGPCRDAMRAAAMRGTVMLASSLQIMEQIGHETAGADPAAAKRQSASRSLRARASIVVWLKAHDLLRILTPEDALPDELRFSCEGEWQWVCPERFFLTLALHWPHDGALKARAWYIRQFLSAAHRGVPWAHLVLDLVGPGERMPHTGFKGHAQGDPQLAAEVLHEIALASMDGPEVAPWLGLSVLAALDRRVSGAWDLAFQYVDRCLADAELMSRGDPLDQGNLYRCFEGLEGLSAWVVKAAQIPWQILSRAPLPDPLDDSFLARLLDAWERFSRRSGDPSSRDRLALFNRLTSFPLTREHANRLLAIALGDPDVLGQVERSRLHSIILAADPVPVDRLPDAEAFFGWQWREAPKEAIAAYRHLGGVEAEVRIRAWVRGPLDEAKRSPEPAFLEPVIPTLERVQAAPEMLTDELRDELIAWCRRLAIRSLLSVHREAPWFVDEALLVEVVEQRAEAADEEWTDWREVDLPGCLQPAVRRRAQVIADEREFLALARWLRKQGEPPAELVTLTLRRIEQSATVEDRMGHCMGWLAEVLASRTLWEKHGPRVIEVLVERKAWQAIYQLMLCSVRGPQSPKAPKAPKVLKAPKAEADPHPGLLPAMHEALALVLLRRVEAALRGDHPDTASVALQALVALHPPSKLFKKLSAMRSLPLPSPEVSDLLELNLRLHRKKTTGEATLSDVDVALSFLADASGA